MAKRKTGVRKPGKVRKSAPRKTQEPRRAQKTNEKFERPIFREEKKMLRELHAKVKRELVPLLNENSTPATIRRETNRIEREFQKEYGKRRVQKSVRPTFERIDSDSADEAKEIFTTPDKKAVTVKRNKEVTARVRQSADRIRDNTTRTMADIRKSINEGLEDPANWKQIRDDIRLAPGSKKARTPFTKATSRAKFIAVNEVGEEIGTSDEERSKANEARIYRWQSREDERVRNTHETLNQGVFSWSPGGATIDGVKYFPARDPGFNSGAPTIPGKPYNCRCKAIFITPDEGE